MRQFFIENKHKDTIMAWCYDRMEFRKQFIWFPYYVSRSREAFRLDIFNDDDASFFILTWSELISESR